MEPHNIEVTTTSGASKWIRSITSHTVEEIKEALENNEIINLIDAEGGETTVDMDSVFMIRFQNDEIFKRRSQQVANGRRHNS